MKVGRAAFDQEAIRVLEELHPDVRFDWTRILEARPPAAGAEPAPGSRRAERRTVRASRAAQLPAQPQPEPSAPSRVTSPGDPGEPPTASPTIPSVDSGDPGTRPETPFSGATRFTRVFDRDVDESDEPPGGNRASQPSAAERVLGTTKLELFRARYAELLTRLDGRVSDAARRAVLREEAERLNPDAWVTESEVGAGAAGFEAALESLNRVIGRKRRRRRARRSSAHTGFPGAEGVAEEPAADGDAGLGAQSSSTDEVDDDAT